ncbi:MAG: hypothetical protein J6125_00410, partial [Clostridia bacterium]|nr:hypothetical protein [Clostridia bacterium]
EEMERLADKRPSLDVIRRSRPDAWREMLLASGGNAGKLAELADGSKADGSAHMRECVRTILVTAAQKRGYASLSEQVQRMGTKRQQAADHLSLLYDGLRDLALISRDEEIEMIFWLDREEARAVSHRLGEARIAAMCRAVADAREALSKNANVPLVLSTLTLKFS